MTLGIKEVSSKHDETKYRYWVMSDYTSPALNKSKVYRLYARVEASGQNGTFRLSETKIDMKAESGYYHFLMGYLGAESEGARSWGRCYGFTEILPGQITTEIIQDPNARLVIDLVQGTIKGPVTIMAGSTGYESLADKPNLTVYKTKAEFNVFANQISGQVSQINTKLGATESDLDSLNAWTRQKISQVETGLSGANDKIYSLQTAGFITQAQGNTLYASAQDMNGNNLVSLITQTPTAINLLSRDIVLTGNTTFNSFKVKTENSLAKKPDKSELGNLAYKSMVGKAQLDSTIIDGGFIKTSLIKTDAIFANMANIGGFSIAPSGGSSGKILSWSKYNYFGQPSGTIALGPYGWNTSKGVVNVNIFSSIKTATDPISVGIAGSSEAFGIGVLGTTDGYGINLPYAYSKWAGYFGGNIYVSEKIRCRKVEATTFVYVQNHFSDVYNGGSYTSIEGVTADIENIRKLYIKGGIIVGYAAREV